VATLLRDVPANAAYFGGYEIIQRMMIPGLNYLESYFMWFLAFLF